MDGKRGRGGGIRGYMDARRYRDHRDHWDLPNEINGLAACPTGTGPGPDWTYWDQGGWAGFPILALDLGQHTGWALRTTDGVITSGTAQFRPGRFEGGGMVYLRFRGWLQELDETAGGIGAVFFEEVVRHLGTAASHAYGGYLAHLTAWAEALRLPYQGVPVGTIKRHATGKGNAGKDQVIAAVRARGFAPADDNEADALALLDWAMAHRLGFGATVAPVAPRKRGERR
jgi:Holliday junction resolvasome RuvABC endonuclease subunit